jgi:hypothetical protein
MIGFLVYMCFIFRLAKIFRYNFHIMQFGMNDFHSQLWNIQIASEQQLEVKERKLGRGGNFRTIQFASSWHL